MDQSTRKFIEEHLQDDVIALGLKAGRFPDVDMKLAVKQITGRQKLFHKVPFLYDNPEILYPVKLSVEQASSQITAEYKASLVSGNTFADLTGGFGIDFLFISRKFHRGIYVERDEALCELARHNFSLLEISDFEIVNTDSKNYISMLPEVDLVYLDPHRRNEAGKKTVYIADCEPDISKMIPTLLSKTSRILVKLSPMLDIHKAVKDIHPVSEIHIVSVENECKEVLLLIDSKIDGDRKLLVKTISFFKNREPQLFDFYMHEEERSVAAYADEIEHYLYEPNSAIFKSGGFKLISHRFNLKKLHPNTHLYTSNVLDKDFPGRIFEVDEVLDNRKNSLKMLARKYTQANVAVRNYPLSVEEYKKKSGIRDGGANYVFACRLFSGDYLNIVCRKAK